MLLLSSALFSQFFFSKKFLSGTYQCVEHFGSRSGLTFCQTVCKSYQQTTKDIWFRRCSHGGHLGYQNGTILVILNLHVSPMPPAKFFVLYVLWYGRNVVGRISIWPPWLPSWISETECFLQFKISSWCLPSGLVQLLTFNIYEHDKFHAQLSWARKSFITLGPG